jgi:hypothetical protein
MAMTSIAMTAACALIWCDVLNGLDNSSSLDDRIIQSVITKAKAGGWSEQEIIMILGDTPANFRASVEPFTKAVTKAKTVAVYEGLPHQHFEPSLLEAERKEKKTVKLHGFDFYADPIELKPELTKQLNARGSDRNSYSRYRGAKLCGGFHPDWCLEWKDGDQTYRLLLCFGCGEAKLHGSKIEALTELNEEQKKQWSDLLDPLYKNRPKREPKK